DPRQYFIKSMRGVRFLSRIPLLRRLIPDEHKMKTMLDEANHRHTGVRWMLENNEQDWINSFFGCREEQRQIKSWQQGYQLYIPSSEAVLLDHGYDENKPTHELDLRDIQEAANFRGGECLSTSMTRGDLYTPLRWRCHRGHEFMATPNLILKGGHWCDVCERTAWNFADYAKHSPFLAQVWTPLHSDRHAVRVLKQYSDRTVLDLAA
ncbi:MAG: hypothetical protein PVG63_05760, partial [Anaerolineales bacterium]